MEYEIFREYWKECKICKLSLKEIQKKYGGANKYFSQSFLKHLSLDHNITDYGEYFEQYCLLNRPICECKICGQKVNVYYKGKNLYWKKYKCGYTLETQAWSKQAKITRRGAGNPMFGKSAWNKGLDNSDIRIKRMSEKRIGTKASEYSKRKMSESAKKRIIHGHTGHKHTTEVCELLRKYTLERIKNGQFPQNDTLPCRLVENILKELKITYIKENIIDVWCFDFFLTELNVYLEIDGDYWHSNPKFYPDGPKTKSQKINHYRDLKKNNFCIQNNLKLIRFWEDDIINNIEWIKQQLCTLKK